MSNIPKLRFKEFSGEWKRKKLSSFSSKCNEKNKDESITDVFTNSAVNGIVAQKDFFDKDIANQNNLAGYYIVNNNDFVYNPRISSSAPVGPLNRNHLQTGVMSPLYTVFSINNDNKISLDYLERYFKSSKWYEYMYSIANYGARSDRMNVTNNDFFSMPIPLPTKSEQQKIASFLTSVDKRIENLQLKIDNLKLYKKGIMQKIFSQEIRFKADDGSEFPEWVEKKLGDLCNVAKSGGTPTSTNKEYYDGDIPFLAISDITTQGKYLTYTSKTVSQKGIDNSASWLVPENTIIYSMYASVGFVSINKIPLATSQAVINLILKDVADTEFIYYYLLDYKQYIHRFIETGTQGNLNAQSVKSLKINLPCPKEQTKIANFLSSIDSKIDQVTKQLEHTKEFKKGLLQQMFV